MNYFSPWSYGTATFKRINKIYHHCSKILLHTWDKNIHSRLVILELSMQLTYSSAVAIWRPLNLCMTHSLTLHGTHDALAAFSSGGKEKGNGEKNINTQNQWRSLQLKMREMLRKARDLGREEWMRVTRSRTYDIVDCYL